MASDITRPPQTASYRPQIWGGRLSTLLDGRPVFTWLEAERMRFDPQVQLGLRILRAPLYGVTWKVRADNAVAERWIDRELKAIYTRMMPRMVRHFEYGVACGEVTYKAVKSRQGRRIHFHDFLEVHPQDARPFLWQRGKRSGQIAALQIKNASSTGFDGASTVYLDRRHSFWFKGESEFGDWWGRPRLVGAYQPWFDKGSRHAANDAIRLFYRKQAFKGPVLYFPPGVTDVGTPEQPILKNNQDIARELVEKFQNGGVLAMPGISDDKGNMHWRWEDPKTLGDLQGLIEYKKMLDRDILVGLGIPPELVDAATVGSGYSGRAIPAQVFFSSMDEEAIRIIQAIDEQVLRPLVRMNFGPVGYSVTPDSLAQLVARDPAQAGQMPGAQGSGQMGVGGGERVDPMHQLGPRGGHRIVDPKTGRVSYEHQNRKPRIRLSHIAQADHSVSPLEARKLWDKAKGEMLVPLGAKW